MPNLTINGQIFDFPTSGQEPNWADGLSGWAEEVTTVLNSIAGTGTINETQVTIDNNATNKVVNGLLFNEAFTQGMEITYRIYRKTDSIELAEKGSLDVVFKPGAVEKWFISRRIDAGDDSLVALDITDQGQITYTTTPIAGTNYQGYIRFKTKNVLE